MKQNGYFDIQCVHTACKANFCRIKSNRGPYNVTTGINCALVSPLRLIIFNQKGKNPRRCLSISLSLSLFTRVTIATGDSRMYAHIHTVL